MVRHPGLEPGTLALKGRCSTIELMVQFRFVEHDYSLVFITLIRFFISSQEVTRDSLSGKILSIAIYKSHKRLYSKEEVFKSFPSLGLGIPLGTHHLVISLGTAEITSLLRGGPLTFSYLGTL